MKKKILFVLLISVSLCACATDSQNAQNAFTPAVNVSNQQTKTVEPVIQQAMPSHVVKLNLTKLSKTKHRRLSGVAAINAANKKAKREPNSNEYINSIMTYDYMPGALYQVYCAPLSVTDIQFQPGENVISVAAGDTLRWEVSKTYSGEGVSRREHILIKPTDNGLQNGLVVTTSKRTYHLMLHATSRTYMASVQWRYSDSPAGSFVKNFSNPNSVSTASSGPQGLNLNELDFNYNVEVVNGYQPAWLPIMVFNDGQKTYIEFPKNIQDSPTLFIGDNPSNDQAVNYRVEGNYYVVDQVIGKAQLRTGQQYQTIVQLSYVE